MMIHQPWKQKLVLPNHPVRKHHVAVAAGINKIIIYGGITVSASNSDRSGEIFILNPSTGSLISHEPTTSHGNVPLPRSGHAGCAISLSTRLLPHLPTTSDTFVDGMLVIGGWCGQKVRAAVDEIWFLDFNDFAWHRLTNTSNPPPPCNFASLDYFPHKNTAVLFRGGDGQTVHSEIHFFDATTGQWTLVQTSGCKPLARAGHASVAFNNSLIIIGGWDGQRVFDDMWTFCLESLEWTQLHSNIPIGPRADVTLTAYNSKHPSPTHLASQTRISYSSAAKSTVMETVF